MKVDNIDKEIFLAFLDDSEKEYTTSDIAKKIFEINDRYELIKKSSMISYRLDGWVEKELLTVKKSNNKNHYKINTERIHTGEGLLKINGIDVDMGMSMALEIEEGNYFIFFLDV